MVEENSQIETKTNSVSLESIQKDVIQLLGDVSNLIEHTKLSVIDSSANKKSDAKYNQFQEQFSQVSENVSELQLKMAIVAPMKAGKSTIINAIAGQELLPSCATAMTTMPTEIIFSTQLVEPVLNFTEDTYNIFHHLYQDIRNKIKLSDINSLQEKLSRYPHLLDLLTEIATNQNFIQNREINGRQNINLTLNKLNHLIRLYSVLEPTAKPLAEITNIPQIKTPFLGLSGIKQAQTLGDLVIIDTPGPNEAGENLQLTETVKEQLNKSSIILLVLDYTQLNNEAAELIKEQIRPILDLIGKENIYVLVNKIDQRRKGDITAEQVQDFVIADLELESTNMANRIFEISAIRALTATQFLLESSNKPQAKLLELESLESLAQEVFGIDWDEEIEDITPKILTKKARKLWHKSGFAPFLEDAIAKLMENAAPRSLISALNLSQNRLLELRDDINLRGKAVTKSKAKLKTEIAALETDLTNLNACRDRLKQAKELKMRLRANIEVLLTKLKQEAKVSLETYFAEQEYQNSNLKQKANIKTRELLLTNIGDFDLLPKFFSQNIKSNLEPKTTGIINFNTTKEAEEFTQEALIQTKRRLEKLLGIAKEKVGAEVDTTNKNLIELLHKETKPIIQCAQARLQQNFEIVLELPAPAIIQNDDVEMQDNLVKRKTRLIEGGYEEQLIKKRAWYYWFGLVPFYSQEICQKPYKQENYYTISVGDLVKQINTTNDGFIDEIKQKIIIYLEEDINQKIDKFFDNLDTYLNSYLQSIQQSQQAKELSLEKRTKLIKVLYCLLPETTGYIEKTNNYLQIAEEFLSARDRD